MVETASSSYIGRFAPSPTGPLHAGSLVAALASWLDAKAHRGQWLVRIEDIDTPRCAPGADQIILQQLAACSLHPDAPPVYQSHRGHLYQNALTRLIEQLQAYPCGCSRQDIQAATNVQHLTSGNFSSVQQKFEMRKRHRELIYPGTCRDGLHGKQARSWRFLTGFSPSNTPTIQQIRSQVAPILEATNVRWVDRLLGPQTQNVTEDVGDFVLKRADGLWAYQLAVVVDDAAQGVTHIVRGQDLADNTARQILLQRALGLPQPLYLHTPLVLGANGEKLSKQNGAQPLDTTQPITSLQIAGQHLGLRLNAASYGSASDYLLAALAHWRVKNPKHHGNA